MIIFIKLGLYRHIGAELLLLINDVLTKLMEVDLENLCIQNVT